MSPKRLALSRRSFLQIAAAASASAALSRPVWADPADEIFDDGSDEVPAGVVGEPERVIVVGAGFAGLAAANALANAGVEVVVLESRDRIGGRAKTRDVVGLPVDQGCQWISQPIGNPMTQWAEQVGVGVARADFSDDIGTFTAYDTATGLLSGQEIATAFLQTAFFDAQAADLLAELGPRATIAEGIERFLDVNSITGDLRRRAQVLLRDAVVELDFAAAANDLSLDGYINSPPNPYSGPEWIPVGGYGELVEPLAAGLDVRLRHRVTRIVHGSDGVVVHVKAKKDGRPRIRTIEGSHVVVTLPLGVLKAGRVGFDPLLPIEKVRSIQRLGVGFLEKVTLGFDEPFWQAGGGTHLAYLSQQRGEFPIFFDLQQFQGGPVLQAFAGGDFGRRMSQMSRQAIRERTLEILREVYGPNVPSPRETRVTRWFADPDTRGSYSSIPVGATYDDLDALATPVGGRLLFAGEATNRFRSAFADGALSTGIREAKRLLGQPTVRLRPLAGPAASAGAAAERIRARLAHWSANRVTATG